MALFVNDATAYINQMIPNISTLVACKAGIEPNVMITFNLIMAEIEHSVCTKHGDSNCTYRDTSGDTKMSGETQGTVRVVSLWSIKSHTILQAHKEPYKGINLSHITGTRPINKNNNVFIDDANAKAEIQGNNFYLSKLKTVVHLERGAQLRAELISATGG